MELFRLLGTIAVDNSQANQALEETSGKGSSAESKLSGAFSKMGSAAVQVGKVISVGMVAAGTAVAGLVTKSVQSYAEYEQLVGGVETLFGKSAQTVQDYAANAYKTAGMSANDYMETVTGFSASLLQSLGGDTAAAADYADMAITDMSDNANKMGTNMESITNAYQGFAKQNYTMLDNLKLGYGGTKEEMQRLLEDATAISGIEYDISSYADVVAAIHVIQTEMGITGTTAKEASNTISGSIASMKASWQNLLTAISADDLPFDDYMDNFVSSVSTVCDNVLPRVEIALNGVVSLINALAPQIIGAIPQLMSTLLPSVVSATTSIVQAVASALPGLVSVIVECIPDVISAFETIFNTIIESLPGLMESIAAALPGLSGQLVSGIMSMITTVVSNFDDIITPIVAAIPGIIVNIVNALVENLPALIEGCINMIMGIVNTLPQIIQALVDAAPLIITTIINALVENVPLLVQGCIQIVMGIVNALPQIIQSLVQALPTIITAIVEGLITCVPMLIEAGGQLLMGLFEGMIALIGQIPEILASIGKAIIDGIKALFGIHSPSTVMMEIGQAIMQGLIDGIKALFSGISELWNSLKEITSQAFNSIKSGISNAWNSIKSATSTAWNAVKSTVSSVISGVSSTISSGMDKAKSVVSTALNAVKSTFSTIWNGIKSTVSSVVSGISSAVSSGMSKAKSVVSNVMSGIKSTFSTGWNTAKSVASSALSGISSAVSSGMSAAKSTASSALEGIKDKFSTIWDGAKNIVSGAVSALKGMMNFSWELPKIKLPHFSISGSFSLNPPSIPHLSVEWYKKAMDNAMLLDNPTIFGYNSETGKFMGGGDGNGTEVVSGANTLMGMIQSAVADENIAVAYYLKKLIDILSTYFPQILDSMDREIVLDSGAMVGAMAVPLNEALGKLSTRRDRGR